MVYYGDNDYRDYLAHHGVKGMKWGHKKNDFNPLVKTVDNTGANNAKPEYTRFKIGNDTKTKVQPLPEVAGVVGGGAGKIYEDDRLKLDLADARNREQQEKGHQEYLRKKKERAVKTGKNIVSTLLGGFGGMLIRNLFNR